MLHYHTTPQPFYGPFPGPPGWAGARRELLDFMVQGKINCLILFLNTPTIRMGATPSSAHLLHLHLPIFYRLDALPAAQPTVSKHYSVKNKSLFQAVCKQIGMEVVVNG